MREQFWHLPLNELSKDEWEALCDRCGKCCLIKLEDEDTGEIAFTNLACKLFDSKKCQCADYSKRLGIVDDCLTLDMKSVPEAEYWLPKSCAYVLRFHDKPLPEWHYLIAGGFEAMHTGGHSMKNRTQSEEVISNFDEAVKYIDWEIE